MLTVDMESFGLAAGQRLLDVGCGEGRHTLAAYLHTGVMAVGVDLGFDDLQTASGRIADMDAYKPQGEIAFLQGDATGLPFPDDYFDRVVCSEVLEHIPNFIAVLDELNRVLKPGGRLCVSVPRAWPERICWWLSEAYHNTPGGHIRIFNAGFLRGEISRYGLSCYGSMAPTRCTCPTGGCAACCGVRGNSNPGRRVSSLPGLGPHEAAGPDPLAGPVVQSLDG